MTLASLSCLVLVGALMSGCGGKKTISTPDGDVNITHTGDGTAITIEGEEGRGKIEIEGDQQSGTLTTEEGEVSFELNRGVAEEEIGIPFYPGAEMETTASWSGRGDQGGEATHVTLTTADSVDEAKAFYEEKLPNVTTTLDMGSGEVRVVHMSVTEGDVQKMVMISHDAESGKTTIGLSSGRFGE
jgi:hypothetical protein